MPRTSGRRSDLRSGAAWTAWTVLATLVATGCAAMPSDGSPARVDSPQGSGAENLQVRVFPVAPRKDEDPSALLAGFLDASNADEATYQTALKYLTTGAAHRWHPEAGVAVLSSTSGRLGAPNTVKPDDTRTEIVLTGSRVAQLDAKHTYRSVAGEDYQQKFGFVKETEGPDKGEWRIDQLPDGLIVDQTNFKNGYRAVHRFFYAASDPSAASFSAPVLVPDPIYLRRRIDPLTAAAQALADGPSDWLDKAVYSAFAGAKIVNTVSVNDNRVATVKVDVPDLGGRQQQLCRQMAGQLFYTLADQQGKGQLDRLDLGGVKGGCSVDATLTAKNAPGSLTGEAGAQQYYLLESGVLMQTQGETEGRPVLGVLGQASQPKVGDFAVRRDGSAAAAVSSDGRSLYVAAFAEGSKLGPAVVGSNAPRPGQGLASPSWDGRQDLWVVDRDPAAPRVLLIRGQTVVPVQVDDLGGWTVRALKISSDGARIALVLGDGTDVQKLMVGVVVHTGTVGHPTVQITGLRAVAPQLTDVSSVSWADTDQLLVLGKEPGKLQQLHYVGTDGSQSTDSPVQGGDSMAGVSASETRSGDVVPVLAVSSDHRLYRLFSNQWREVAPLRRGTAFGYPG